MAAAGGTVSGPASSCKPGRTSTGAAPSAPDSKLSNQVSTIVSLLSTLCRGSPLVTHVGRHSWNQTEGRWTSDLQVVWRDLSLVPSSGPVAFSTARLDGVGSGRRRALRAGHHAAGGPPAGAPVRGTKGAAQIHGGVDGADPRPATSRQFRGEIAPTAHRLYPQQRHRRSDRRHRHRRYEHTERRRYDRCFYQHANESCFVVVKFLLVHLPAFCCSFWGELHGRCWTDAA